MKLAIIVCGKSPTAMPGGLGSYSYNIAKIFHELGYQVHLLGYADNDELIKLDFGLLHQVKNPYLKLVSFGNFFIVPKIVNKTCRIIKASNADDVIIFGAAIWGKVAIDIKKKFNSNDVNISTIAAYFTTYKHEYEGQVRGAPITDYGISYNICLRLLLFFTSIYHSKMELNVLKNIDRIIVHYDSAIRIITDEFPDVDARKIVNIPYYIDLYDRISETQLESRNITNKKCIVTICRHDPRKGINSLLKAIRILSYTGLEFNCVIAGTGFFRKKHIQLSNKLGISHLVSFPGFISSTEELLLSADIFVISSLEEGSGAVTVLEAMKCGLPIVTTRCDGIPEDLTHEKTAIIVEMDNPEQLAEELERLLRNSELRNYIAGNAKIEFNNRFSFNQMKEGLKNCLENIK